MAYEMDSEALQRLQRAYAEMSDAELFDLARRPDDLTEMAHEVLRGEMTRRGIERALDEPMGGPASSAGQGDEPRFEAGQTLPESKIGLITFHDSIEAGRACEVLEAEGIEVDIRDVSEKTNLGTIYGGPPVALQVIVSRSDRDRAVRVLREKMRLFPEQEVEEAEPAVDDGTVAVVGMFGRREDAEEIARILDDARIWHRIVANPEGSAETEDAYALEVREIDLTKAGDVVERAMGPS